MSSDPFAFFGLDRKTATEAEVRAAYAARLKTTRPEDDRAGFMALRAAFEQARSEIRWRDEYGDDDYSDDDHGDDDHGDDAASVPASDASEHPEPDYIVEATEIREVPGEMLAEGEAAAAALAPDSDDARISHAMDRIIDVLTATGEPPDVALLMAAVDHAEVSGIDDYQALQWELRHFLCDRTGYNLEPPELRVPRWLSREVFDALDEHFGWTRQPVMQSWVRQRNDWLVRVGKEVGSGAPPAGSARPELPAVTTPWTSKSDDKGSQIWLWIGIAIIAAQVIGYVARTGGG